MSEFPAFRLPCGEARSNLDTGKHTASADCPRRAEIICQVPPERFADILIESLPRIITLPTVSLLGQYNYLKAGKALVVY